ncbi:MAG TPA: hypothetical protein VGV61_09465 [Thermoanaerobaculia bacterium]|nr:hypothetical protein [Thermoanaerobaculia bacterium]
MSRSPRTQLAFATLGISLSAACTAHGAAPAVVATPPAAGETARSELVGEAASLQFHSAFWPNLHHLLYAEAWAHRGVPARESLAGALPEPLQADLSPAERAAWQQAVDYYDRELAAKDLLFDPRLDEIRRALLAGGASAEPPAGLPAEHRAVLAAAAPVYRAHWWSAHDRANRAWIAAATAEVQSLSPAVPARLAALYRTPWFTSPARVDVVFVASRQGAYTQLDPLPAHLTISSSDPHNQGLAAGEIVFHEASHALVRPVEEAFSKEARAAGKPIGVLWHVALFYLTGEVVRQALAARGVDYTPYLYATGLFDRAWPQLEAPVETHWRPYVDGKASLDDAVRRVIAAYQTPR